MSTLLSVLDLIVLLLLITHVASSVRRKQPQDNGYLVLSIFVAAALIIFLYVSITAYIGLVNELSLASQVIFLLMLIVMAAILGLSWSNKSPHVS